MGGFTVVLLILLFATQVTFDLYARSAVTSAAVDAARSVADYSRSSAYGSPTGETAEQAAVIQAEERAKSALGSYGRVTTFRWTLLPSAAEPQIVELNVRFDLRGTRYSLVGPLTLPGLNQFSKTVRVRIERVVCRQQHTCSVVVDRSDGSPGVGGTSR